MPDNATQTRARRLTLPVGHHFLLFLLFLGLKLGGAIEWHWVWVFLPLIAKTALLGAALAREILKASDDNTDEENEEE